MFRAFVLIITILMIGATITTLARGPSYPFSLSPLRVSSYTIYLDRNGKIIPDRNNKNKKLIDFQQATTFILRTTRTTEDLYGPDGDSSGNRFRGRCNPITRKEAKKIERHLRQGKFGEAQATGNLIELWPLAWRIYEWAAIKDNKKGGQDDVNNREYGVTRYQDTVKMNIGAVGTPLFPVEIEVTTSKLLLTNMHSHPSGSMDDGGSNTYSFIQPPSNVDIKTVPPNKGYWTIFGMGSGCVYLYDSTGVIAVIPIKKYIR